MMLLLLPLVVGRVWPRRAGEHEKRRRGGERAGSFERRHYYSLGQSVEERRAAAHTREETQHRTRNPWLLEHLSLAGAVQFVLAEPERRRKEEGRFRWVWEYGSLGPER